MTPEEKALERLLKAIEAANIDTVSPRELIELFENTVAVIREILDENAKDTDDKLKSHKDQIDNEFIKKTNGLIDRVENFREKLNEVKNKLSDKFYDKLDRLDNKLSSQINSLEENLNNNTLGSKIDKLEEKFQKKFEENRPDTPEEVRDKLASLKGNDRLDASAIKGLDERIKSVASGTSGTNHGIVGRDVVIDIDLSPQLDGVTTTFNIRAVYNIISVSLSSFPYGSLRKGVDYTYTPTTITFTSEIVAAAQLSEGQKCIITAIAA